MAHFTEDYSADGLNVMLSSNWSLISHLQASDFKVPAYSASILPLITGRLDATLFTAVFA
jgi:hypothetical protein